MQISKELYEQLCKLNVAMMKDGQEYPNPVPLAVNIGLKPEISLDKRIKMIIENSLSMRAHEQGYDTFDEAQDFEVEGEFDLPLNDTKYQKLIDEKPPKPKPDAVAEKSEALSAEAPDTAKPDQPVVDESD